MGATRALALLLAAAASVPAVRGMRAAGTANDNIGDTLFFVTFFVIGNPGEATVAWDVRGTVNGTVDIAAFRQEDWVVAKGRDCDCDCKLRLAWRNTSETLAPTPAAGEAAGQFTVAHADVIDYYYVALVLCGPNASASLQWDAHVTFTETGRWPELDYAAVGLPETYASAAAVAGALLLLAMCQHRWWSGAGWAATPTPVKAVVGALALWLLSAALSAAHWLQYVRDGVGFPNWEPAARAAEVCSRLVMTGLLLLLARGWSVTRSFTRLGDAVGVGGVLATLLAGYCAVCREYW